MPVTDKKMELRGRGATGFETDGYRYLPVTIPNYIEGLLDADERIKMSWLPEGLLGATPMFGAILSQTGSQNLGILDAYLTGGEAEIGKYFIVKNQMTLTTYSDIWFAAGAQDVDGDSIDNPDPDVVVEDGDKLVVVDYDGVNYIIDIIPTSYRRASVAEYGIVKLYDGVDSVSTLLAATANAVKTAYDLAASKETAFAKNTAFNKNFSASGVGGNGTSENVAREDHHHNGDHFQYTLDPYQVIGGQLQFDNGVLTNHDVVDLRDTFYTETEADANFEPKNSNIQTHIADVTKHRVINDASVALTELWSASKLNGLFQANSSNVLAIDKRGMYSYASVGAADLGGHNENDIVIVEV